MTDDRLAELMVLCTERLDRDGPTAVEALCDEHPELAAELREAIAPLLACGLVGASPAVAERPAVIGEFTILGELGRGGMGVVYEARQQSLGRTVALKVLAAALDSDGAALERFRREGANAARLHHPGIAQVYAVGCDQGRHFLSMERIDGAPLDRVLGVLRIRPAGSLTGDSLSAAAEQLCGGPAGEQSASALRRGNYVHAVARVAEQVAEALTEAHAHGVVHRDVKPSNVMLRRDGSVVLTDFGLARHRDDPSLTREGSFAGTPFYTSPEQAAARGDIDHRTDLFSLGALLYELLTLQVPFAGSNTTEVLRNIQVREPADPRRWNANVPRDLVAILQRLLEKETSRRYAQAAAVAADLRAFLEGRPVSVRPITAPGRCLRWARRQPLQAALLGLLIVGAPLVIGLTTYAWSTRSKVLAAEARQRDETAQQAILAGYIALGEARDADGVRLLREALHYNSEDPEAWAGLAQAALRRDAETAGALLVELQGHEVAVAASRTLQRCCAELLKKVGRVDDAQAELARLGAPSESLESFWVGMRILAEVIGRDDEAQERIAYDHLLDAVVATPRARPAFLYWLAVAAGELGDEPGARRAARALATFWPESAYAWSGVGLALHRIDPQAAIDAYRRALQLMPELLAVRNNLANALDRAGRRRESIDELREILKSKPDYGVVRYNLGRSLFYEEDLQEAVVHLQRAVELEPDERRSQHYLSWCLLRLGRNAEALAAAQAATELLPTDALMWRDVCRAQLALQRPDEALAAAQRAVQLAAGDPANHRQLAEAQVAAKDPAGARRSLQRVVELAEPGMARQRALEDVARFLVGKRGVGGYEPKDGLAIAEQLAEQTQRKDPWVLELLLDSQLANGAKTEAERTMDEALELLAKANARDSLALRERLQERRAKGL